MARSTVEEVLRRWRGVREVVRNEGWLRRGEGCSVTGSIIICINMYCLINRLVILSKPPKFENAYILKEPNISELENNYSCCYNFL